MNLARTRVGDASNDLSGDLLTDDAPYTGTMLNSAWRWLQASAYTSGVETPIETVVLFGLPMRASNDVAYPAFVSWTGCSDGVDAYDTPALPQNVIQPISVKRRYSGSMGGFCPMKQAEAGLPEGLDCDVYDWSTDTLFFYGSTQAQDMRIRYAAFSPDLDITKPTQQIPMMGCEDCLSARIAFEYASARGAVGAQAMMQMSLDAFATIAQRTSRRKQRATFRRQPAFGGYSGPRWPFIQ